ncbi:hypothetical protein [Mycobacterium phage Weirdo19]|uniref:Uncharacterized protein n=1 Tax=Mycobacterium phage Weirdo19 TaxID=2601610 RepID=A0A6M2YSX1_9CAUD|nr:hypothetical protein KDJ11_gp42 [Mycobacterium phage Weirdo19]QEA10810.1 hypothetical protein [Mycobacterium phage Weirdo19]
MSRSPRPLPSAGAPPTHPRAIPDPKASPPMRTPRQIEPPTRALPMSLPVDLEAFGDGAVVYIAELDLVDGAGGYISAHRTEAGAIGKLVEFAARLGITIDDYGPTGPGVLDDHPEVASHAVMRVPLEP